MNHFFEHKHILLGITGSIAAYKSADLVRQLKKMGAEVRVVMTESAQKFMTPLTLQSLSGYPVRSEMFPARMDVNIEHIDLAKWADIVLIAPASANFLARLTYGLANDLLSTLCLATDALIAVAPAMNQGMWVNPTTQHNVQTLKDRGVLLLGPDIGSQACGDYGAGRMLNPSDMLERLRALFPVGALAGVNVLITSGPTYEPIDPVRFIGNFSSGKMGRALAEAAFEAGASVKFISGPSSEIISESIDCINVMTAEEMFEQVQSHLDSTDIFISAAAVSDYRPKETFHQKMKKAASELQIQLVKNPDMLSFVSSCKCRPFTVGFAAESESLIENAHKKLIQKKLDMIVANQINIQGQGFGSDQNEVTVLSSDQVIEFPLTSKMQLAQKLIQLISQQYKDHYAKSST